MSPLRTLALSLLAAAPLQAVDLKIDFNQRSTANNTPANTEGGFLPMTINPALTGALGPAIITSATFGTQSVTISGTGSGTTSYDDRKRTFPVNSGDFTQQALLQDFIFALFNTNTNPDGGLDITIAGLEPDKEYAVTLWSYDQSSGGTRVSDWSITGGGTAEDYTFDGRVAPTTNSEYQINLEGRADASGNLTISARRDPTSKDTANVNQHGVFLNGLWIRDLFRDADADGMPDGWESTYGLNPAVNDAALDADNDLLPNLAEFTAGTNPKDPDSDDDSLPDGAETNSGTWLSTTNTGTNPLKLDSDGDGLPDGTENPDLPSTGPAQPGTDPTKYDSDGDTFGDGTEISWPTNPRDPAVFPNPAAGSTLAVDIEDIVPLIQPGFESLAGTGTAAAAEVSAVFGTRTVTITAVGSTTLQSRDRAGAAGGNDFNPLFRDFIFANTSSDDGDGMDITITGLAPLTSYPVTLWIWDPTSTVTPRRSTWLASDGPNPPTVKIPVYSLEGLTTPNTLADRRVQFTAVSDPSGTLVIQGRKETGYNVAAANVNVFLNAFIIGAPVNDAPIVITSLTPVTPAGLTLTWLSEQGSRYHIDFSPDLSSWLPAASSVEGLPGSTSWTDSSAPAGTLQRFYRIRRAP
jgi:hypothetical protein